VKRPSVIINPGMPRTTTIVRMKKINVKDSKMLVHPTRIRLSKIIKESALAFHITKTSPQE
jgi:ribonuclease HII